MIQLATHPQGVCLAVRAQAGARRNQLRGEQDGELKVAVTTAPEKGRANRAIQDLLCHQLQLRKSQLTLLSGHSSNHKVFLIQDCPPQTLRLRIEQAIGQSD